MNDLVRNALMGAAGAAGDKTYVDDVFSTYVKSFYGSTNIVNNIDLAGEGGLVWTKIRNNTDSHYLADTVNGVNKTLKSDSSSALTNNSYAISAFNNNGFTYNDGYGGAKDYATWTFRKAPGFFDVVTFTSTGAANQRIPHSLECEPGLIICKCVSASSYWAVYHREIATMNPSDPWSKSLLLDENYGAQTYASDTWGTGPTSTDFGFKAGGFAATGADWVAYVFAGGESTADTARSVNLGTTGWMNTPATSDFAFGTGDFTVECWVKFDDPSTNGGIWNIATGTGLAGPSSQAVGWNGSLWTMYANGETSANITAYPTYAGAWYHTAYVRHNNTVTLYVNGKAVITATDSTNWSTNTALAIGGYYSSSYTHDGKISNLRVVKGTAVYTSAFRPPTQPLTNITNTTMLCCNNSSVTGKTVGPSITSWGPTASTDSPFDDPEGFKFGEGGDQNIIKTGIYTGNGSATGPEINLGWEPQWVLVKNTSSSDSWRIFDNMRGIVTGGDDALIHPNSSGAEYSGNTNEMDLTSTGFKIRINDSGVNGNGYTYTYMALRRPDGDVGKPVEAGTDVFTMDVAGSSSPAFDSGFPVDFALVKNPSTTDSWDMAARLIQTRNLKPTTAAETSYSSNMFDYSDSWLDNTSYSGIQSWMWKRHAGFDVITYKSDGVAGRQLPHSLGQPPEMLWIKDREHTRAWAVYHKGLNSGTNPEDYWLTLDSSDAEASNTNIWHSTAPTATHISLGASHPVNTNLIHNMICLAFASVDGISKVGSYSGSSYDVTVTTGFTPRLVLVKKVNQAAHWQIFDSVRGMGASGNDGQMTLNTTAAQNSSKDYVNTIATGFVMKAGADGDTNAAGGEYIYYAHA